MGAVIIGVVRCNHLDGNGVTLMNRPFAITSLANPPMEYIATNGNVPLNPEF